MRSKFVVPAVILAVLTAACPSKRNEVGEPLIEQSPTSDTASATHPASPGGTAVVPSTESGTTVLIAVTENSIAVTNPDAIPPGNAVFSVRNGGQQVHNLFVEGPGVSKAAGDDLAPGKSADFAVALQPGTYTLYCPVLDHRKNGEDVVLTIKPVTAPGPASTTAPATGTTGTPGTGATATTATSSGT